MPVLLFYEEPFLPRLALSEPRERKLSPELFTFENKAELSRFKLRFCLTARDHLIGSSIPNHHRSRAVGSFGDNAFKIDVLDWVVRNHYRKPFVGGIQDGLLGIAQDLRTPPILRRKS